VAFLHRPGIRGHFMQGPGENGMRTTGRIVAAALLLLSLALTGCATTKGRISNDRYYSPLDNFDMPIPSWTGLRIQDEYDETGGSVSFHGDFGGLTSVYYLRLPPDKRAILIDPKSMDAAYSSTLHGYAMPQLFRKTSPRSSILHEEFLGEGVDRAYFAVVKLPEGSTLVDAKTGRRLDATRTLLIFGYGEFLYMVTTQTEWTIAQREMIVDNLRKITASMAFKR
jgi:hypothetical protein